MLHLLNIPRAGTGSIAKGIEGAIKAEHAKLEKPSTTLMDIPEGEKVIFVLRDPVERFVSQFWTKKNRAKLLPGKGAVTALNAFETPNQLAHALADAQPAHQEVALRAIQIIGGFEPLSKWFQNSEYVEHRAADIGFAFLFDNLQGDWKNFLSQCNYPGAPEEIPHKNNGGVYESLDTLGHYAIQQLYRKDYEVIYTLLRLTWHQ